MYELELELFFFFARHFFLNLRDAAVLLLCLPLLRPAPRIAETSGATKINISTKFIFHNRNVLLRNLI